LDDTQASCFFKRKKGTALTIHLRQISDILGSLSFVIIDDKEIIFAVPTVTRTETAQLKALQLGTGIVFTDCEGSLVKEMLNLFDDLRLKADEILTLESNTEDTESSNAKGAG
jgi:hypothetical protein